MGFDVGGHDYYFEYDREFNKVVRELQRLYTNRWDVIRRYPVKWVRNDVARDIATHYATRIKIEHKRYWNYADELDTEEEQYDYEGLDEQEDRLEKFIRRCLERQRQPMIAVDRFMTPV